MADGLMLSNDDTVQILDRKAKESKADSFKLRVLRRPREGMPPLAFASFDDAQVSHFAQPEVWLPDLADGAGGVFELLAHHVSEPNLPIGGVIKFQIDGDTQKPPNLDAPTMPNWRGPRQLSFPRAPRARMEIPGIPGGPPDFSSQAQRREPVAGHGIPGAPIPPIVPSPLGFTPPHIREAEEALARRQRELDETERRTREAALRAELLGEMKSIAAAFTAELREMRAVQAAAPAKPGMNVAELITSLTPIIVPLIQGIQAGQQESQKRMEALLTAMTQRPTTDPMVQQLLDKLTTLATQPQAGAEIVASMAQGMGAVTQSLMQVVHTAAEMSSGQPQQAGEPGWVKAIREGVKAVVAMAQMQQSQAQQLMATGGHAPLPAGPAAARLPPTGGTNGARRPPAAPQPALQRIERAIQGHQDPAQVAAAFVGAVKQNEPSIVQALQSVGGDIDELFKQRLGAWAISDPKNMAYVERLGEEMEKVGKKAGLLDEADEGEDGEGEDEAPVEVEAAPPPAPAPAPAAKPKPTAPKGAMFSGRRPPPIPLRQQAPAATAEVAVEAAPTLDPEEEP